MRLAAWFLDVSPAAPCIWSETFVVSQLTMPILALIPPLGDAETRELVSGDVGKFYVTFTICFFLLANGVYFYGLALGEIAMAL